MTSRRILLVEDDERDIELTLAALSDSRLDQEVVVVRDGEQALDYLYQRGCYADRGDSEPVVMFLDLKLPKVDGLEVLRAIKADPAMKHLPVVMVTSSRQDSDIQTSYERGVNAYVVKPLGFEQFTQAIRQLGLFWALLNEPPPPDMTAA